MLTDKRFVFLQPNHHNGTFALQNSSWTNDSFANLSRVLGSAKMYNPFDANIDMEADVYVICQYDINSIEKEIELAKSLKDKGAKTIACFSQDHRFTLGQDLINKNCTLYTELCEVVDAIACGCNPDLRVYGRFQNKVIEMESIENLNFSIPYENREYDFIMCNNLNEYSLSYEIELMLMIREKYPNKRLAIIINGYLQELIQKLRQKFPQIEFPFIEGVSLNYYLQLSKAFCNPELRPRPGRMFLEAYYYRVPFMSPSCTYYSRICPDFTFSNQDLHVMLEKYDLICNYKFNEVVSYMENRAQYCSEENVYKRIKEKLNI